jgi:hypothetical protein
MNKPDIYSDAISKLVRCALSDGNEVSEISDGWTQVRQVVHMRKPLSKVVREQFAELPLRYWTTESTPHNKAEEGFTDDVEKVAVTFPK